jgi:hypothetical protein
MAATMAARANAEADIPELVDRRRRASSSRRSSSTMKRTRSSNSRGRPSRVAGAIGLTIHFVLQLCKRLSGRASPPWRGDVSAIGRTGCQRGWSITLKPRADRRPPEPWRDARRVEPVLAAAPRAIMHSIADSLRLEAQGLGQLAHCDEFAAHARHPGAHRTQSVAPLHATLPKSPKGLRCPPRSTGGSQSAEIERWSRPARERAARRRRGRPFRLGCHACQACQRRQDGRVSAVPPERLRDGVSTDTPRR